MSVQLVSPKPSKNQTIAQPFIVLLKGQADLEIIVSDSENDIDGNKALAHDINGSNAEYTWATSHVSTASEVSIVANENITVVYFRIYAHLNSGDDLIWQIEPLLAADWADIMEQMPSMSSVELPIEVGRVAVRADSVYCAEYDSLNNIPARKDLNKLTKSNSNSEWVYFKLTETTLSTFYVL